MLLKLERVGVHNNFFGLGGHSLLAIQIINRLEESFGLEVPLDVIFNSPSVAELAAYVDASMYTVYSDVSSPSNAGGGERESGEI
jgi:hypothetical protein